MRRGHSTDSSEDSVDVLEDKAGEDEAPRAPPLVDGRQALSVVLSVPRPEAVQAPSDLF